MDAQSALALIHLFERHRLEVCIDGGWAVDALLGHQTRHHVDLDIALPNRHVPVLRQVLAERGFQEEIRDDTWACNFVLVDTDGLAVDVHAYELDEFGNNVYGVPYLAEHLTGSGSIMDHAVRCISPAWLVRFHTGYEIDDTDFRDVSALCQKFSLPLPSDYHRFLPGGPVTSPASAKGTTSEG